MRKLILIISLLVFVVSAGQVKSSVTTCPSSGVKPISATQKKVVTYTIVADIANTGSVCWGDSGITTSTAPCLQVGMSFTGQPQGNSAAYDLSQIYIACTVNSDAIRWTSD